MRIQYISSSVSVACKIEAFRSFAISFNRLKSKLCSFKSLRPYTGIKRFYYENCSSPSINQERTNFPSIFPRGNMPPLRERSSQLTHGKISLVKELSWKNEYLCDASWPGLGRQWSTSLVLGCNLNLRSPD